MALELNLVIISNQVTEHRNGQILGHLECRSMEGRDSDHACAPSVSPEESCLHPQFIDKMG